MIDRCRRLAVPSLIALSLLALGGCGRHHRQELQGGSEPPLAATGDGPKSPPIVNRESPTVQGWAGGN